MCVILFWIYIIEYIDLNDTICTSCTKPLCILTAVCFLKSTKTLVIKQKIAFCEYKNYYHTKKGERGPYHVLDKNEKMERSQEEKKKRGNKNLYI